MKSTTTYKGSPSGCVYKIGFEDVKRVDIEKVIRVDY
jgi:hypothetical protein